MYRGTRNGDARILFKVTSITNKRTKSSPMALRKRREVRDPWVLLTLGGSQ